MVNERKGAILNIVDLEEENEITYDEDILEAVSDSEDEIDDLYEVELNFRPTLQPKNIDTFIKICENYQYKNDSFRYEKNTWLLIRGLYENIQTIHEKLQNKTLFWLEEIFAPTNSISNENSKLLERVWYRIRKGEYEEAKEECRNEKEFWRATSIQTPSVKFLQSRYEIWQKCCLQIASQTNNDFEYAIYSTLGGRFQRESPLISTWEDHLWQNVKLADPNKDFREIISSASISANNFFNKVQILLLQKNYDELKRLIFDTHSSSRNYQRFGVHLFIYLKYQKEEVGDIDSIIENYLKDFIRIFSSKIYVQWDYLTHFFYYLNPNIWRTIIVNYLREIAVLPMIFPNFWEKCETSLTKLSLQNPNFVSEIPLLVVNQIILHINSENSKIDGYQNMINSAFEWANVKYPRNPIALYPIVNRILRILIINTDHINYAREFVYLVSSKLKSFLDLHPKEDEEFKFLTKIILYEWKQSDQFLFEAYKISWKELMDKLRKDSHINKDRDVNDFETILRKYIPLSVIHTIKIDPANWKKVAIEIADEKTAYYQLFDKQKLQEFLLEISQIEIAVLEKRLVLPQNNDDNDEGNSDSDDNIIPNNDIIDDSMADDFEESFEFE